MKLLVLLSLAALVAVNAAPSLDKDWLTIPGVDGKNNLAILNAPNFEPRVDDPYTEITFHLYTRSNRNSPAQIWVGALAGAPFQANRPTKFIIHGFTDNGFTEWAIGFKDKFLDAEDCNVICVDWSGPAQGPLYNVAQANAQPTGDYVAQMHNFLSNNYGHNVGNTHCIGHSLGAHVCGFSGKYASGTLGRVTGMDPALPLFNPDDPTNRLDASDASYVDVIHSCSGWLGFERALGHADFYPNGGSFVQPGCEPDLTGACSHGRSHEFFSESIVSNGFVAKECGSWDSYQAGLCSFANEGIMGNPSSTSTRGTYYLATSAASPFALG